MKKTLIATAVAASVLAPIGAQAVNVSPNDHGQVLLYPYYNVNQGNQTFIAVANTTQYAKVIKVRFREAVESEDVLDFQVWLSPYDHWTAVMTQSGGQVRINTNDTTCTVPSLASGASLLTDRISSSYAGNILDRISEGHAEIIEMATIFEGSIPNMGTATPANDLLTGITHVNGVPADCSTPVRFNAAPLTTIRGTGMGVTCTSNNGVYGCLSGPMGGLYGIAAVFNPTDGTYFTYTATGLEDFARYPLFYAQRGVTYNNAGMDVTSDEVVLAEHGVLLFDLPDLSTPDVTEVPTTSADIATVHGIVYAPLGNCPNSNNNGCVVKASYSVTGLEITDTTAGIPWGAAENKRLAVTAALMANTMANDFLTGSLYDTDWVFTFPGKYMFRDYPRDAMGNLLLEGNYPMDPDGPFTASVTRSTGQGCEAVTIVGNQSGLAGVVDREENQLAASADVGFSPGAASDPFRLCYEVNVMAINEDGDSAYSSALASKAVLNAENDNWPTYGFAELAFAQEMAADVLSHTGGSGYNGLQGLPFLGFAAITDRSTDVTRGGTFMHHISRGMPTNVGP